MVKHKASKGQKHWTSWPVTTLKTVLIKNGITLSLKRQPKAYYQALYEDWLKDKETMDCVPNLHVDNSAQQPLNQLFHSHNTRGVSHSLDSVTQDILGNVPVRQPSRASAVEVPTQLAATLHPRGGLAASATLGQPCSGRPTLNPLVSQSSLEPTTSLPAAVNARDPLDSPADQGLLSVLKSISGLLQRLEKVKTLPAPTPPADLNTALRSPLWTGTGSGNVYQQLAGGSGSTASHQGDSIRMDLADQNIFSLGNSFQTSQNTALPAYPKCGPSSDSLPQVEILSNNVRKEIISGKNVNLASLLIPGVTTALHDLQGRNMMFGEVLIPLKPDKRLTKSLTIQEFISAFTTYKNVMCEAYPHRRPELDAYMKDIIDMSTRFGGTAFYEYHKLFSSRASALLQTYNVKVDWSQRDTRLYTTVFASCRANNCSVCSSIEHTTDFCSLTAYGDNQGSSKKGGQNGNLGGNNINQPKKYFPNNNYLGPSFDTQGRTRVRMQGKEICNNFNSEIGCNRTLCSFLHVCLVCRATTHPASKCGKSGTFAGPASSNTTSNKGSGFTKSKNGQ